MEKVQLVMKMVKTKMKEGKLTAKMCKLQSKSGRKDTKIIKTQWIFGENVKNQMWEQISQTDPKTDWYMSIKCAWEL